MMLISRILLVGGFLLLPTAQQEQGWHGLVSLHSTRADVERLLGRSKDPCNCIYETQTEFIDIDYATGPCKGSVQGWNVSAGTVLTITVRPKGDLRFSQLNLDLSKYVKTYDDTLTEYYTSTDAGITYAVPQSGLVDSITYSPSLRDNSLRCIEWPLRSAGQAFLNPRSFDNYSDISWPDETGRLDNFAVYLLQQPTTRAYIIVYGGRRARRGEARARAKRAKNYLVTRRRVDAGRILTINGGHRKQSAVELYALPPDAPPPTPHPTVFQMKDKLKKPNQKRLQVGHLSCLGTTTEIELTYDCTPQIKPQNPVPLTGAQVDKLGSNLQKFLDDPECGKFINAMLGSLPNDVWKTSKSGGSLMDTFNRIKNGGGFWSGDTVRRASRHQPSPPGIQWLLAFFL